MGDRRFHRRRRKVVVNEILGEIVGQEYRVAGYEDDLMIIVRAPFLDTPIVIT